MQSGAQIWEAEAHKIQNDVMFQRQKSTEQRRALLSGKNLEQRQERDKDVLTGITAMPCELQSG
jgi:hypothetical protein